MNKTLIIAALVLIGIVIGGDIGSAIVGFIIICLIFYGTYRFFIAVIQAGIETFKKPSVDKDELIKVDDKVFFKFIRHSALCV